MKYFVLSSFFFLAQQTMGQPDFYHLEVSATNASLEVFLNGVPVHQSDNEFDAPASIPIQLFMIGKDNVLEVQASASKKNKPGQVVLNINPYNKGDYSDTQSESSKVARLELELGDTIEKKSIIFDNEGHNYSYIFKNGDILSEEEVLKYGRKLYQLLQQGKAIEFVKEMPHRSKDYASNYGVSQEQVEQMIAQQLAESFFNEKYPDLDEDRLEANSFNSGRVWEITIDGHEFLKKEDDDGSFQMPVWVAKINGSISIVR